MNKAQTSGLTDLIENAFEAATDAVSEFRAKYGEPWYCGFAWVTVRPGNSPVAKLLKTKYNCSKGYSGGVTVWAPGAGWTQSMDLKEAGAYAFAKVLRAAGIDATVESRAD